MGARVLAESKKPMTKPKKFSPGGCELITADQLFRKLDQGYGHRCMGGRAPEGYLEIWPDWRNTILHITYKENAKLGAMIDAEVARRKALKA
jgi:hypothetical protein